MRLSDTDSLMLHRPPRSFRRILLLRLLFFSIPILLIGQYATVRKARSSLLDTARQNLTSSAVRKATDLNRSLTFSQTVLQTLSRTTLLQQGDLAEVEARLPDELSQLPLLVECFQLRPAAEDPAVEDPAAGDPGPGTCEASLPIPTWPTTLDSNQPIPFILSPTKEVVPSIQDPISSRVATTQDQANGYSSFSVVISVPIYGVDNQLRYTLTLKATLSQPKNIRPGLLVGETIIIDSQGVLLLHPDPELVGAHVSTVRDPEGRLASIQRNVYTGNSNTIHLFGFVPGPLEWLAGYTGMDVEIALGESDRWTVLAMTPIDHALQGLKDIQDVLILLTLGLLGANALLAILVASSLSRPIERLSHHARKIQDLAHIKEVPDHFGVRELENLAEILNNMMKRLEERAQALRHAWQDAQLANQLKSEFLANTSHELRTPLNAIIGCIRLVRDDCCDSEEEAQEFLNRADKAALHLLRIINDILDIAKIEAGKVTLKPEKVDVLHLVNEVVDLQALHIQQKHLKLVQPDLTEPVWILADRAKLKQVLLNLIYNAIKFTDKGVIKIEIDVQLDKETQINGGNSGNGLSPGFDEGLPRPRVLVTVTDTGIGIDPEQRHKLFQPFVMIDGSTTRRFEGTGLGLAISKNFIDLMGGAIEIHSEGVGKGATAIIGLPLAPSEILSPTKSLTGSTSISN